MVLYGLIRSFVIGDFSAREAYCIYVYLSNPQQLQQRMALRQYIFQFAVPRSHSLAIPQLPLFSLLLLNPFEFGQSSFMIFAEGLCFF